jgi:Fe-S cluster assembly protein SufD
MKGSWTELSASLEKLVPVTHQAWFHAWRQEAIERFNELGLPTSKHENWRATPLRKLYADSYVSSSSVAPLQLNCDVPRDAYVIHIKDNVVQIDFEDIEPGVVVMPLIDAIDTHPDLVQASLGQVLKHADGFTALNSALFNAGIWIYIPEGIQLDKPIFIHHQSAPDTMSFCRHLVQLEAGASARIVEYFHNTDEHSSYIHQATEIILKENAHCQHIQIQELNSTVKCHMTNGVKQHQSSQFNSFLMQLGADMSMSDFLIDLVEEHATVNLSGLFLPKHKQFHQQRLQVNHHVGNCHSQQNYRGILDNEAQAVFIGQVFVDKNAQKTEAHQSNKNIILSKTAQMVTCPQLQIYADDVICSHGATVGQLDDDALFYLQSRGFTQQDAKAMLVKAFIMAHFDVIPDEALRQWCIEKIIHS